MFAKLHARLGDFWWYSLMLFCACRAADVLNAVVGLWLVPKYVGPAELGAVMPLSQLAGFLALPVTIFAMTFMKEMTVLATNREYGRMKSLMRGVFIGAGIFLIIALAATRFALPHFLERIRVGEGSLGILIVATGFIGAIAPIYSNALQALKRFKTISFLSIAGAPIRFLTMILTMPYRALSGYFVGQAAAPAFSIITSVWALRKELSVPAEPYWTKPVFRRFTFLFLGIAAYSIAGNALSLVEQTVLRQRIPDIDSAAYYMATRFSDIATFIACTLLTVLFPFTASLAAKGRPTRPLVIKSSVAMSVSGGLSALIFYVIGDDLLLFLPNSDKYAAYGWSIPWITIITTLAAIQAFHTNTEVSAGRFGFLRWWMPVNLIFVIGLLFITGQGYFSGHLPETWHKHLSSYNLTSLKSMLVWFTITTFIKTSIAFFELSTQKQQHE